MQFLMAELFKKLIENKVINLDDTREVFEQVSKKVHFEDEITFLNGMYKLIAPSVDWPPEA